MYEDYIVACDEIAFNLKEKMDSKRETTTTNSTNLEIVSLRLFERLLGNYTGAIELYNKNLYVQVGTLTRSIFEDYLNILYIHRDSDREKLTGRYLDYAKLVEPYWLYDRANKLADELGDLSLLNETYPQERINEIENNKQSFISKYDNKIKSWSGWNFLQLSKEAIEKDKYYRYYGNMSNATHGSPLADFAKEEITITVFLSLISFSALADLIGENDLFTKATEIKDRLLLEPNIVL